MSSMHAMRQGLDVLLGGRTPAQETEFEQLYVDCGHLDSHPLGLAIGGGDQALTFQGLHVVAFPGYTEPSVNGMRIIARKLVQEYYAKRVTFHRLRIIAADPAEKPRPGLTGSEF